MPLRGGHHGAKLTLFMPSVVEDDEYDAMEPFPLFAKYKTGQYMYLGTYRQPRYSDRLSYAEMEVEVPARVKTHRAREACKKPKPKWLVDAMISEQCVSTDEEAQAVEPQDILEAFQRVRRCST